MEPTPPFNSLEHALLPLTAALFTSLVALLFWLFSAAAWMLPLVWWMPLWLVFLASSSVFLFQWNRLLRGPESLGTGLSVLTGSLSLFAAYLTLRTPISLSAYGPWLVAPLLAIWVGSGMGRSLAGITKLADQLGDQGTATLAWQQETMNHSIGPFAAAMMGWLLVSGVLTGAAQSFFSANNLLFTIVTAGLIFSGLLLQGFSYLHRLRIIWQLQRVAVHPALCRRWLKACLAWSTALTAIVLLLPADWLRLPWGEIGLWISERWQFSSPSSAPAQTLPAAPPSVDLPLIMVENEPHWLTVVAYGLVVLLILAAVLLPILALVGFLILYFRDEEGPKLPLLLLLPAAVYQQVYQVWLHLQRAYRKMLRRRRARTTTAAVRPDMEPFHKHHQNGESAQAARLGDMYQQLRQTAQRHGVAILPGTGPRRTGQYIQEQVPDLESSIQEFIALVQKGRYSGDPLSDLSAEKARQLYATIEFSLQGDDKP